LMAPTENCQQ